MELISYLSSTTQLTHAGYYSVLEIGSAINDNVVDTNTFTDYNAGDFKVLLISSSFNDQGCRFGTLIITSPRFQCDFWTCQIWENKFVRFKKVTTNSDFKYDILWEGQTSQLGEIILSSSCANKYNCFIIQSGAGGESMWYTIENPSAKFVLSSGTDALCYQTYKGIGRLLGVQGSGGLKLKLDANGGEELRKIIGVARPY